MDRTAIYTAFTEYYWLNNREPESIAVFCEKAGIEPTVFKTQFLNFSNLKKQLLIDTFNGVWEKVEVVAEEHGYTNREKALALFFTLIEAFTPYKHYLKQVYGFKDLQAAVSDWRSFNHEFVAKTAFLNPDERLQWLREKLPSKLTNEVNGLLVAWNYVFRVWMADESEDQATTDAAIEKTIHLYFDFANTDQLEKVLDFGKFVFSTKVKM